MRRGLSSQWHCWREEIWKRGDTTGTADRAAGQHSLPLPQDAGRRKALPPSLCGPRLLHALSVYTFIEL